MTVIQLTGRTVAVSSRHRMVLDQLGLGEGNKSIGIALGITEATVKVHVKALCRLAGARNRTELVLWALANNLILNPAGVESFVVTLSDLLTNLNAASEKIEDAKVIVQNTVTEAERRISAAREGEAECHA